MRRQVMTRLGLAVALAVGVGLTVRSEAPGPSHEPGPLIGQQETIKQTEVEAVAVARSSGRSIEIGAYRGERRDVWANPDGTFTENIHQQPVRTAKNGKWVTPDATLVRNADGSLSPVAATFGLRLSGGGSGPLLTADRAGRSMSLTWAGSALPAPVLDGATATYPDVVPGVDLVVNAGVETFSHVLVVKTPAAARRPDVASLAMGLKMTGLAMREAGDGRLTVVDTVSGGRVFEAPQPVMWDAGDEAAERQLAAQVGEVPAKPTRAAPQTARKAKLQVRFTGDKLHLTPDPALLTDPSVRFPLYIDPVWSSTSRTFWTMVDSGYPDEEYANFDGKTDERAGYCPPDSTCNNSKIKRLIYALPSNYSGKNVLSAQFQVSLARGWNTTARNIQLWGMNGGINTATNWNNMPGWARHISTKSLGAEQSCTSSARNSVFDATSEVQLAAASGWTTTTFGIKAENESNNQYWKRFCNNAILVVNWNRAPNQPAVQDLTLSPGGNCVSGASRPYVDTPPRLSAVLTDPDHLADGGDVEDLIAEFRVQWTPAGGTLQTVTWQSSWKASGSRFDYTVPSTIPQNVTISWDVRAWDGTVWGPWSSDGSPPTCEFVYDNTTPTPPLVSSPEFLDDELVDCATYTDATWRDGVGVYTTFTFDSAATDVVEYRYGINTNPSPSNVLRPASDGGPVQLTWLATKDGPNFVTVQAVDRAAKASAIANCTFRVSAGRAPVALWDLSDAAGATVAADEQGTAPATVHGAVEFGAAGPGGPSDRAGRFDGIGGTDATYLSTDTDGLIDTAKSFTVSAWVRLASTSQSRTVLSQDGAGEPGFTLGFDSGSGKWLFAMPTNDVDTLGRWNVFSATAAQVDVWTHLTAVHDVKTQTIMLYVNGQAVTSAPRRSAWTSHGPVQIGRGIDKNWYNNHFHGDLAEVAMFNRIVVAGEVAKLAELKPVRQGYWQLNGQTGGVSPELAGGSGLTLGGGAGIAELDLFADPPVFPMIGQGELRLDGVDDHAFTASPLIHTDRSFTVAVRARVASADPGPAMTVLSQKGTSQASGFIVRRNADNRWELAVPVSDTAGAAEVKAFDDQALPNTAQEGQLLVLTYNAVTNELRLYVDGQLAQSAKATRVTAWDAAGGLQVGRAFIDGQWREPFAGAVDEVRAYAGVLDLTTIQQLNQISEQNDL
ncbi:LamG-like jellyroll fold domain-containing protein [Dactylosporangium sp. AC04546]|uniref:LamG-like jellyroll fold domain-containing protein n=1 Tax=Dactylosporangium sp. AC04546 TaxID=2862460 RepID=UPI001EDC9749|nr:LamG-like jellyroll fold domain-containing protein [Dactylosporangium sp. AC04546]WVK79887.1 LamG-like jellyroll fold domain-containing protein [Dactylosporangium sp. AC04546]